MITDTVLVALISLIGTGCGSYFANRKNTALISYRLEQLEDQVKKHNNLVERTYELETRASVLEDKIQHLEKEVVQ